MYVNLKFKLLQKITKYNQVEEKRRSFIYLKSIIVAIMSDDISNNNKKRVRDTSILEYVDCTNAPRAKKIKKNFNDINTVQKVLEELPLTQLLSVVNKSLKRDRKSLFMCYDCKKLCIHTYFDSTNDHLEIDADGESRPFCDDCTRWCGDEPYSSHMQYEHDEHDCLDFSIVE